MSSVANIVLSALLSIVLLLEQLRKSPNNTIKKSPNNCKCDRTLRYSMRIKDDMLQFGVYETTISKNSMGVNVTDFYDPIKPHIF